MKKLFGLLFFLVLFLWLSPTVVRAAWCSDWTLNGENSGLVTSPTDQPKLTFTLKIHDFIDSDLFSICSDNCRDLPGDFTLDVTPDKIINGDYSFSIISGTGNKFGDHQIKVRNKTAKNRFADISTFNYTVKSSAAGQDCSINFESSTDPNGKQFTPNTTISVRGYAPVKTTVKGWTVNDWKLVVKGPSLNQPYKLSPAASGSYSTSLGRFTNGGYVGIMRGFIYTDKTSTADFCQASFCILDNGCDQDTNPGAVDSGNVCQNLDNSDDTTACSICFSRGNVWTALGCIKTNSLNEFVAWFVEKLIFVASGIAFLLMAFGAIQIITSSGSPEKVKAGQELLTAAVSGLLFIILSVFLLKLIGVDILQIPGFAK